MRYAVLASDTAIRTRLGAKPGEEQTVLRRAIRAQRLRLGARSDGDTVVALLAEAGGAGTSTETGG